jgi:hypothetical protein
MSKIGTRKMIHLCNTLIYFKIKIHVIQKKERIEMYVCRKEIKEVIMIEEG